mmetsp:Transcript_46932/g.91616  ORF Transcript_46932/g.91616 Transcript_46932/m.91616 type:complete len:203 (+) Transcript_46932:511-1119(+)
MALLFCYFTCGAVGGCRKILLGAEAAAVPRKEAPPSYPDRTVPRQKAPPQSPTRKLHTGPPQDVPPHSPTVPWQDALPQFIDRTRYAMTLHVLPQSPPRTCRRDPPPGRADAVSRLDIPPQSTARTLLRGSPPETPHGSPSESSPVVNRQKTTTRSPTRTSRLILSRPTGRTRCRSPSPGCVPQQDVLSQSYAWICRCSPLP